MNEQRLYCIMRTDLRAPVGKLMAQAGHAFVSSLELARMRGYDINHYMENQQPKIVLRAKNETILRRSLEACEASKIPAYLVVDSGRTIFKSPTVTCLGIGPVAQNELPKVVRRLQLLGDLREERAMKYMIEGTFTEVDSEDSGYTLIGHTQFDDLTMLGNEHDGKFFVRLHSYQENDGEPISHPIMQSIIGKKIRITVESTDDDEFEGKTADTNS